MDSKHDELAAALADRQHRAALASKEKNDAK